MQRIRRDFLFICLLLLAPYQLMAQADISMATSWYNRANYNPASIARPDYIYLFTNIRKQWMGVEGAPTVFNVQASELNYRYHSAYGISLVSDKIGESQVINPMLSYAYRIGKTEERWLSFGLAAGIYGRFTDGSLYEAANPADPSIYTSLESAIAPDINMGVEFQSPYCILGASSTHLLSIGKSANTYLNTNHLYGYAIYKNTNSEFINYSIGSQIVARNSLLVYEANTSLRFKRATGLTPGPKEMFDIGLTYRTSKQLTLLLGINLSPNMRVGYAYDQSFVTGYNANTSHEIMLEYRLPSRRASACNCHNENYWYF